VWPQHWDAMRLLLVCLGQLELHLGAMGGAHYAPARAVNVQQELRWLGVPRKQHTQVVQQYRVMEREALLVLNEQERQRLANR